MESIVPGLANKDPMVVPDLKDIAPQTWYLLAIMLATTLAWRAWNRPKLPPMVNAPALFDFMGIKCKVDFMKRSSEIMDAAREKFGDKPYMVYSDTGPIIILSPKHVNEVRSDPKLSFLKNTESDFNAYLSGFEPFRAGMAIAITINVAKKQLTKMLGSPTAATVTKPLSEEATFSLNKIFGESTEWHEEPLSASILDFVARLSSRVFLGDELCRNEEWLKITVLYAVDSFIAAFKLRVVPTPFRRIVHWFLPDSARVRGHLNRARSIVQVVIDKRRAEKQAAAAAEGRPVPTHNDAIEWGEQESQRVSYEPAVYQLTLAGAAIHTTSDLLTQTILNLLRHPELIDALRAEIIEVLRKDGWEKTSLFNLKLMDSVVKETQRMKPIQLTTIGRIAEAEIKLSDGTVIPKGGKCAVANTTRDDPSIYENPEKFDGYRFLRMRETPGKENQAHLVSTSVEHLGFGHGAHACPGRFFAANEIKVALCHLLLKYDIELAPGNAPEVEVIGFSLNADKAARIRVRRRKEEINLEAL